MKSYPSIPHWKEGIWGEKVYAFDKLDGSNIRAEWSKKRGWYKFGSRNVLLTSEQGILNKSIDLFNEKYADALERKFKDDKDLRKSLKFVVFFEFFGEKSFGGHHEEDDNFDVVLFDVNQYQKGLLPPNEFLKKFDDLHVAELVYYGNYNMEFIEQIKNNSFEDYNFKEGVVVKGIRTTKRKNQELIWMSKIKTYEWLNKVKEKLGQKAIEQEFNGDMTLIKEII